MSATRWTHWKACDAVEAFRAAGRQRWPPTSHPERCLFASVISCKLSRHQGTFCCEVPPALERLAKSPQVPCSAWPRMHFQVLQSTAAGTMQEQRTSLARSTTQTFAKSVSSAVPPYDAASVADLSSSAAASPGHTFPLARPPSEGTTARISSGRAGHWIATSSRNLATV